MKTEKNIAFKKLRQRAAFTLQEMLIAVAILVILMAISFPLVTNLLIQLEMSEMDDIAKSIYLEAQYQLAVMKTEGGLAEFETDLRTNHAGRYLTEKPVDYPTYNGGEWMMLCYLTKDDNLTERIIPKVSNTHQMDGDYVIEFHPTKGLVYGVYYWDKSTDIDYATQIASQDRDRAGRTDRRIGYYGGEIAGGIDPDDFESGQEIGLINEEELYLRLTYDLSVLALSNLKVTCIVKDEHGGEWQKTYDDVSDAFTLTDDMKLQYTVLLDSMEDGYRFTDITKDPVTGTSLQAGDQIKVSVKMEYNLAGADKIELSDEKESNSLFAKKYDGGNKGTVVELTRLRHLYNLNRPEVEGSFPNRSGSTKLITIQQMSDIDFNTTEFAWTKADAGGKKYVGKGGTNAVRPIDSMTPIQNTFLFHRDGNSNNVSGAGSDVTVIDGMNHELQNFYITPGGLTTGIGLWYGEPIQTGGTWTTTINSAQNIAFQNMRLVDFAVNAPACNNVGTLIGGTLQTKLLNCGSYLSSEIADPTTDKRGVSGKNGVGGLVGNIMTAGWLTNCYAAVPVSAENNAGGLIGAVTTIAVTQCYASGDVTATGDNAGGFIGLFTTMMATSCYAAGDVTGDEYVGGFTGRALSLAPGSFTWCECYGKVRGSNYAAGFMFREDGVAFTPTWCYFLKQAGYNDRGLTDVVEGKSYSDLKVGTLTADQTHPYAPGLQGRAFPFKQVLPHHYGDWPFGGGIPIPPPERNEEVKEDFLNDNAFVSGLFYFEKYEDGTYGIYAVGVATQNHNPLSPPVVAINTLGVKEEVVTEKGYGLFNKQSNKCEYDIPNDDKEWCKITEFEKMEENPLPDSIKDYDVYLIKELGVDDDASTPYSIRLRVGQSDPINPTIPDITVMRP